MAKVRYKCDYTKLKLCFNKFHNASDDAPKECQFCLLELTDGRYTAGRWDGDDCLENDSVTGKFIRGTADVVEIKEVSKWHALDCYDLTDCLNDEEINCIDLGPEVEEIHSVTFGDFKSLADGDFPKSEQYCLLILQNGRLSAGIWDEYEKALQNPLLWGMLTAGKDNSASHMKFLLDYVCRDLVAENPDLYSEIKLNDDDADYRIVNAYLNFMSPEEERACKRKIGREQTADKNKCREKQISQLWKKIQGTYTTFVNWYQNNKWYHYIGLIISLNKLKNKNFDLAKELRNIYCEYNQKTKDNFELFLKAQIGSLIKINDGEELAKVSYEVKNQADEIIEILLAFNVYHTIISSREENKFNFSLFNDLNITSLEHIHPQHLDDDNLKKEDVEKWVRIRKECLLYWKNNSEEERTKFESLFTELESYLTDNAVFQQNYKRVNDILNELDQGFDDLAEMKSEEMHTLRNMALLTVEDNAAVSNNEITKKRRILNQRERDGLTYALIGTKYAYNKRFTDPDKSTIPSFWMSEDREGYYKAIEDVYNHFMNAKKEYEETLS